MHTRRGFLGALGAGALAPAGLRLPSRAYSKHDLWARTTGPHLRGAVFAQRRVYRALDGDYFLGPGPVGAPISVGALANLAELGANFANWSGPGPFAEAGGYELDQAIVDHIGRWLDQCRSNGLFTVLSFRSGPGRSAFAFHPGETWYPAELYDASLWQNEEKQDAWARMVAWVLEEFGDHPALAGVLALAEPNGLDFGSAQTWLNFAGRIQVQCEGLDAVCPLLLSPDRWARVSEAAALRAHVGLRPVLVTHDYSPWAYTHPQNGSKPGFDADETVPAPSFDLGNAAVLEFGMLNGARNQESYLRQRISVYEQAGCNWAAFRWTSGWEPYESVENRRSLAINPEALSVLRQAFSGSSLRP